MAIRVNYRDSALHYTMVYLYDMNIDGKDRSDTLVFILFNNAYRDLCCKYHNGFINLHKKCN